MSDGFKGTMANVAEAVVKPVVDEVGQALEVGVQSVLNTGPQKTQDPKQAQVQQQQQQQKVAQTQNDLSEARRKIQYWKELEAAQATVRQDQKQVQTQQQQANQQEAQIKQFEIVQKKKQLPPALAMKGKAELKGGVGG